MKKAIIVGLLGGICFFSGQALASSENEHLFCVKEVPNPMSLAARRDYVLMCVTKTPGLTMTNVVVNQGKCRCKAYRSLDNMKLGTRVMWLCRDEGRPCDFTEVAFETTSGEFTFNWDPDRDDAELP